MADLSDVEKSLVAILLALANRANNQLPQIAGNPVRVFRGTPPVAGLGSDRARQVTEICVFPVPDTTRNTTRWAVQSSLVSVTGGLGATAAGQMATFTGSAEAGELAGLLVNGAPFVYRAEAGDSSALVAAALADMVRAGHVVWLSGATLTIPGAVTLVARTAGLATIVQEWGRCEQEFRISVWSPSPATRDMVCATISGSLSEVAFLALPDGSSARLRYVRTESDDSDQVASIYRRDLIYSAEYALTATVHNPVMLFGASDYNTIPTLV